MSDRNKTRVLLTFFVTLILAAAPASSEETGISMQKVIQLSFEHNPTLRSALLDHEQAKVAVRSEDALRPFMLQLDGGYTHSSAPSIDRDGDVNHRQSDTSAAGAQLSKTFPLGTQASARVEGNSTKSDSQDPITGDATGSRSTVGVSAKLEITQPLLKGAGKRVVLASYRQALKSEVQTAMKAQRVASETALSGLVTYWDLWYAQRALEIEIGARDLARAQLEEEKGRVAVGDSAQVDVLSYQTRLAQLEESVVEAEANKAAQSVKLAMQIGFSKSAEGLSALDTDEAILKSFDRDTRGALVEALEKSPEVREQLAAVETARQMLETAGEDERHRLDLTGWLEANTMGNDEVSPAFQQFGQGEAYSAYIGLVYELPLDGTRYDTKRASARLDVEIAIQQLISTRDSVRSEVLTLTESISSARNRLRLARETLAIAERQADAKRASHDLGAAIFIEVQEAEEAVKEAQLRVERAKVDLIQAQLNLEHITGRLLDMYESVIPKM